MITSCVIGLDNFILQDFGSYALFFCKKINVRASLFCDTPTFIIEPKSNSFSTNKCQDYVEILHYVKQKPESLAGPREHQANA